jgi:HSP20 family molecular chaperone IbpA
MTWNDVVSSVKEKIRRGLGRGGSGQEIQVAQQGTQLEPLGEVPLGTPLVDVYENDKELLIFADVPGGTREGATVAWDEARGLTLLVKSQALPSGTPWASEYKPCEWYRALELPDYVDGSKAACTIKDGVLTIRVPKRAAASKLIPVNAG